MSATIASQKQQLEKNRVTIEELLAALRGKTRERIDPKQLLLFETGELETLIRDQAGDEEQADEAAGAKKKRKKKRGHGRGLIPDNLPREEILYELPEEQRLCPIDNKPMPVIRWETSEQLEYIPPQLKVLVHRRAVYACPEKHDEATLLTAPKPPQPIAKGLAGPGLLSAMVVGKFGDHLPGYRLEDILLRHGADIHRSTIYDWLSNVADLTKPLYERLKQRVLSSRIIHTDDTKVKLIDHAIRGTRIARSWAAVRRTPGAAAPICVPSGSSDNPAMPVGRIWVTNRIRTKSMTLHPHGNARARKSSLPPGKVTCRRTLTAAMTEFI